MEQLPKYLYRGVTVDYDMLYKFNFTGVDIVPYKKYDYINSGGKKMRSDNNEWGVYLTENLTMAIEAYGNPGNGKIPLDRTFVFASGSTNSRTIFLPCLGLVYEIDTDGLAIREPLMEGAMFGHYNNGYEGKEWITDLVPSKSYSIKWAVISSDFLHEAKTFNINTTEDLRTIFINEMESRKKRLEIFVTAMKKVPITSRNLMPRDMLKDLFGENGAVYLNTSIMDAKSLEEQFKYVMAQVYNEDIENVDYKNIEYIYLLKEKYKNTNLSIEDIISIENNALHQHDAEFYSEKGVHNNNDMKYIRFLETIKKHIEMNLTPEEKLKNINKSIENSRKNYNAIAVKIEDLMEQKKSNQNISIDDELSKLIEQRDALLDSISNDMKVSKYYEDLVLARATRDLEHTLDIKITDISGYDVKNNVPIEIKKTEEEITSEVKMCLYMIDRMFYSGKIDKARYEELKNKISYVYDYMKEKTSSTYKTTKSDEEYQAVEDRKFNNIEETENIENSRRSR